MRKLVQKDDSSMMNVVKKLQPTIDMSIKNSDKNGNQ